MADSAADVADIPRPVPFEDVGAPWVESAQARLWARWPDGTAPVAAPARRQLAEALARELAAIGSQVYLHEFTRVRGSGPHAPGSRARYRRFVRAARAPRAALSRRYPSLARLLADRASLWVEATDELLRRLVRDRALVSRALCGGAPLDSVVTVRAGLSDPHGGGRSVCLLRFASGAAVVYKPRALALERAFDGLVRWLDARGLAPALRSLAVVDRGTHGWMEVAEPAPCADAAEVRLYYERAGMLLGLAHALGGADLHGENVIACGAHPVLVDLEVLMAAPAVPGGDGRLSGAPDTVLWTQLLPYAVPDPEEGRARVEGGFATRAPGERRIRHGWRHVNTDGMEPSVERAPAPDGPNAPRLYGAVAPLDRHEPAFVDGFRRLYQALVDHRDALAAPGGPLDAFAGARTRVVLRNTRAYLSAIRGSLRPAALSAGARRAPALAPLSLSANVEPPLAAALHRFEQEALLRLDVPAFGAAVDGRDLELPDGSRIPAFFAEAGAERVRRRLAEMDAGDLEAQSAIVRMRVASYRALQEQAVRSDGTPPGDALDAGQAVAEAVRIGRLLESLAIQDAHGIAWLAQERGASGAHGLGRLGPGLGSGRAGVALFLAALHRLSRSDWPRALAVRALDSAAAETEALLGSAEPGFEHGVGGVLYALGRAAGWLACPALLSRAQALADGFANGLRSAHSDVARGLGGYALGLAALYEASPAPSLLAQALLVGDELARRQRTTGADAGAWPDPDGRMRVGFATGAAGVACALHRLARLTGAVGLAEAALRGERFVDGLFVPAIGDWLDAPAERGATPRLALPLASWCAGSAGIGLARVHSPRRGATVGRALAAAERALDEDVPGSDTLAEGVLGPVELLQEAAAAAGARSATAGRHLRGVVLRARMQGTYRVEGEDAHRPGLFSGVAGVGYALLRHADPSLPCVLLGG